MRLQIAALLIVLLGGCETYNPAYRATFPNGSYRTTPYIQLDKTKVTQRDLCAIYEKLDRIVIEKRGNIDLIRPAKRSEIPHRPQCSFIIGQRRN